MKCRILDLSIRDGLDNVALDKVLMENTEKAQDLTIVFTRWNPTVSVGNSQSLALDVDQEACRRNGVTVVRRFSGGQAVYIDNNYIVLGIFGPREFLLSDLSQLTHLRRKLCHEMIPVLEKFRVPAIFHEKDNLVISSNGKTRTLGNSGQFITPKAVNLQASIRYDLSGEDLLLMLEVLKTNGRSLRSLAPQVKQALASLREFTIADINEIKDQLLREFLVVYGCTLSYSKDDLTQEELVRLEKAKKDLIGGRFLDEKRYSSRGVCYFYLNGKCIIPEIAEFLPYNEPSTHLDSTIT